MSCSESCVYLYYKLYVKHIIEVSSFLWLRAYSESRNASSALNWISMFLFLICFCLISLFHFESYIVVFVCVCAFNKFKLDVFVRFFFAIGGIVVTFFIIWPRSKKIAISCSAFAKLFQDVISSSTLSESILHVGRYIYISLEDCATIPIKMLQNIYIDNIFDQQMTFLGVYQI
jgi:hypothetical protein